MNLDPDLLRAFLAVGSHSSFTKAAKALNRTQSTVSHQIRRLEAALGMRLLERSARATRLTQSGAEFRGIAQRIIDLNDEVDALVASARGRKRLRVGVSESLPVIFTTRFLRTVADRLPGLTVSVETGMSEVLRSGVEGESLDVALIASTSQVPEAWRILWRTPLVWAAAEDWSPMEGRRVPLVLCAAPCTNRKAAIDALQENGVAWFEAVTLNTYDKVLDAVRAGLGVSVVADDELDPRCRRLGRQDGFPELPHIALVLACNRREATQAMARCLEDTFRTMQRR